MRVRRRRRGNHPRGADRPLSASATATPAIDPGTHLPGSVTPWQYTPGTADVDLNGDGKVDFRFTSSEFGDGDVTLRNAPLARTNVVWSEASLGASPGILGVPGVMPVFNEGITLNAVPLAAGTIIGPSGTYGLDAQLFSGYLGSPDPSFAAYTQTFGDPAWHDGTNRYLGVYVSANGHRNYGWIRVGATWGIGIGDWAFESTPDTPIIAGAVPEPSSAATVVIGLALVSCRRRGAGFIGGLH